jgi:hypothetical protein
VNIPSVVESCSTLTVSHTVHCRLGMVVSAGLSAYQLFNGSVHTMPQIVKR